MRIDLNNHERVNLVRGIFDRVAHKYDLLNHSLSLGRDMFWRRAAARRVKLFDTGRILDLTTGTGDLALVLACQYPQAVIHGLDFTFAMLEQARKKVMAQALTDRVTLTDGDVLALPFPDDSFDSVTMAFGIRNIPDVGAALSEIKRVLAPGGRVLILELTFPDWSLIRHFYESYLTRLIPKIGGWISGQHQAYQYLADSILDFPNPREFLSLMREAGFRETQYRALTFGIAILHWGEK